MSLRIRIILPVLLAIGLAVVINMVRKRVLELKYVLVWLFSDIILIFLVIFPGLIRKITDMLGIYSQMNMIFFLGFLLSLVIIFTLTVTISKENANVCRMSQTIAMLHKEIQQLQQALPDKEDDHKESAKE